MANGALHSTALQQKKSIIPFAHEKLQMEYL